MSRCPSPLEISDALTHGADAALSMHLRGCPACRQLYQELAEPGRLAQKLPFAAPDRAHVEAVRAQLLRAAAEVQPVKVRPRPAAWTLAAAAAAMLVVGLGLRILWPPGPAQQATARRGMVRPLGEARYVSSGPAGDEIVRLAEGTLVIDVSPLGPGQRFRVVTLDAEVEVHGTTFEVGAAGDRLQHVRVLRGQVELRREQQRSLLLRAGERWQARTEPAPAAAPPEPRPGPVGVPEAPRPAPRPRHRAAMEVPAGPEPPARAAAETPAERAFAEGFDALRAGRYGEAAASFERAAAAGQPLGEDARYWRAVAWARAGRSAEAIRALRDFLARHPSSPRAGGASSILAWQLLDVGQLDEAERLFREALRDPSPQIQKSAREGLAAVAALRAR